MANPEEEVRKLLAVERYLAQAESAVRIARRISGEGMLARALDEALQSLQEAAELAGRAKHIILHQGRPAA